MKDPNDFNQSIEEANKRARIFAEAGCKGNVAAIDQETGDMVVIKFNEKGILPEEPLWKEMSG